MMHLENPSVSSAMMFPTTLTCLGDFLVKFSENSAFSVWIKDIDNFKHIMSNVICRKKWGLEEHGLEGMTTREVLQRVKGFSTLESELDHISTNEAAAIKNNTQSTFVETLLTYDGLVSIQQTILIPVFGFNNRSSALVGVAHDLTRHANLLYLFEVYQQFYPIKKVAVSYFSKYFQLEKYFTTHLSCAELKLLLAMTQNPRAKSVARTLGIATRTVENYSAALKDKLKPNISLELIGHTLRDYQQWTPDLATC